MRPVCLPALCACRPVWFHSLVPAQTAATLVTPACCSLSPLLLLPLQCPAQRSSTVLTLSPTHPPTFLLTACPGPPCRAKAPPGRPALLFPAADEDLGREVAALTDSFFQALGLAPRTVTPPAAPDSTPSQPPARSPSPWGAFTRAAPPPGGSKRRSSSSSMRLLCGAAIIPHVDKAGSPRVPLQHLRTPCLPASC